MDKKDIKKAINQLGRVRKSPALDPLDKKTIERIREKLYNKINNNNNKDVDKMLNENNLIDLIREELDSMEPEIQGASWDVYLETEGTYYDNYTGGGLWLATRGMDYDGDDSKPVLVATIDDGKIELI